MKPHSNTGGDEQSAINDAVFVLNAIPENDLHALGVAFFTHGNLPIEAFAPFAAAHGVGANGQPIE